MFYPYGFYFDPTYVFIVIGMVISMAASAYLNSTFQKYSSVRAKSRITGEETARRILRAAGITDVSIGAIRGQLTDHFDPRSNHVALSDPVYDSNSLAAVCVAAHECGHAIQYAEGYVPLAFRSFLVPIANLGSTLAIPIFILGLIFSLPFLTKVGIICFCGALLFQIVTLPVEFNASFRGLRMLEETGILSEDEIPGGRQVLMAAGMTYVASALATLLQLLRLILLSRERED